MLVFVPPRPCLDLCSGEVRQTSLVVTYFWAGDTSCLSHHIHHKHLLFCPVPVVVWSRKKETQVCIWKDVLLFGYGRVTLVIASAIVPCLDGTPTPFSFALLLLACFISDPRALVVQVEGAPCQLGMPNMVSSRQAAEETSSKENTPRRTHTVCDMMSSAPCVYEFPMFIPRLHGGYGYHEALGR